MASPTLTVYAMPGSQFSAKVLVALDSRGIQHYCSFVNPDPKQRKLPSGGTLVPEMSFNDDIVPDSDAILEYLDKHLGTEFLPAALPACAEVCRRASTVFAAYVLYYNWVHEPSYRRSMARSFERYVSGFFCCCRHSVVDWQLSAARGSFRAKVAEGLGLEPEALPQESQMREKMIAELLSYQAHLLTDDQPYLIASTTRLTAADAALYAQLERLVGDEGDVQLPCALPQLLDDNRLDRLWKWHTRMRRDHPIQFKGKRPPSGAE